MVEHRLDKAGVLGSFPSGGTIFLKENVMPSVRYLDTSMCGSYWIDCEVLEKVSDTQFKVKFYDNVVKEYEVKVVSRDRLQFPKFNDYAFC